MYVGTYNSNSQLASECIVAEPELSQVHEVAELLGQLSCEKVEMSANTEHTFAGHTTRLGTDCCTGRARSN